MTRIVPGGGLAALLAFAALLPALLPAPARIDVLLAPVDRAHTLSHADVIAVIDEIRPALVVPMHYFVPSVLERFIARTEGR